MSDALAAGPVEFVLPYTLHDFQTAFVEDVARCVAADPPGGSYLYSSPTGSGKSLMALARLAADPDAVLVTPRLEIVAGMLDKIGVKGVSEWTDAKLAKEAMRYRITTPVRFLNMLAAGTAPFHPARLIIDEVHHDQADTYQKIRAYLPGVTRIGLTATPFRGTPKSTAAFLADWGEQITQVLNIPQAAERGIIEVPEVELWPLVDDDTIQVVNGEIRASASGDALRPRLGEVVERCRSMVGPLGPTGRSTPLGECLTFEQYAALWDRPTLFAVPATDTVHDLVERLNAAGLPAVGVTQDTPRAERNDAFRGCVAREVAIVQIDVVSEGVDLPIRRLVDLRPTLSPVRWMQQVGRITRPRGKCGACGSKNIRLCESCPVGSVYVCCNRNLERHGYLFCGMIPPQRVAAAQKMFPTRSARAGARAVGLEGVGRFAPAELALMDGCTASMYALYQMDGFERTDYAILLHPAVERPLAARRSSTRDEAGQMTWGKWAWIDEVPGDLKGFQSSAPAEITDKQAAWWQRAAVRHGLDPSEKPTKKTFAALPVLVDLKAKLRVGGF